VVREEMNGTTWM
jgi:hypothetical protein